MSKIIALAKKPVDCDNAPPNFQAEVELNGGFWAGVSMPPTGMARPGR